MPICNSTLLDQNIFFCESNEIGSDNLEDVIDDIEMGSIDSDWNDGVQLSTPASILARSSDDVKTMKAGAIDWLS